MQLIRIVLTIFLAISFVACSSDDEPDPIKENGDFKRIVFVDDSTVSISPREDDNFAIAEFKLWLPVETKSPRALLILVEFYNGNGHHMARDENWREFARQEDLGIIAVNFFSDSNHGGYFEASYGSGRALEEGVEALANFKNLPQMATIPYLLRGYSAGGVYSFSYSAYYPDKVAAVVDIRGGGLNLHQADNQFIPGLLLNGELEANDLLTYARGHVERYREEGGLWAYAIEPGVNHYGDLDPSDELVRAFFSAVLKKRLHPVTNTLQEIAQESGFLGDNVTKTYASFHDYQGNKTKASWLIDEEFAIKWSDFQK